MIATVTDIYRNATLALDYCHENGGDVTALLKTRRAARLALGHMGLTADEIDAIC
jgi:hypothetical protein